MTFDIVTIFPAMIEQPLAAGILGRAIERGTLAVKVRDLREFTTDRHRVVDDVPYGGGPGMVLKAEPIFRALDAIEEDRSASLTAGRRLHVIMMSPQGRRFTHEDAKRLSECSHIVVLCGRYEGFDDRVRERVAEELSIGDYVLTGGELPALVILDAVARFVPGVVGDEQSVSADSFNRGLLDFPQFTRPAEVSSGRVLKVPEILLSGNHGEIRRWRKREALSRTLDRRPDLLADAALDDEEVEILKELRHERD